MEEENKDLEESSQNSVDFEVEPEQANEPLNVEGPKNVIDQLLKKNKVQIMFIVGLLFFLFILILAMFSHSSDVLNYPYKEGVSCERVKITYDPYNETLEDEVSYMSLEDYVKSAVWAYSKDILDPPDGMFNFYTTLAIALRTEVVQNGCEITYRDKKLTNVSENDTDLENAMKFSKGLVLTDLQENILKIPVSAFCWKKLDEEQLRYELFALNGMQIPYDFAREHMGESVYLSCECNRYTDILIDSCEELSSFENEMCYESWVTDTNEEDEPIECAHAWVHQDDTDGFSVFGAFYLIQVFGKDYTSVFQYFFGDQIKIMTIEKLGEESEVLADNSSCSEFSLTSTDLSKMAFVNKVKSFSGSGKSDWALFQENADLIYDIAIANHFNPELIIVRAILEGFSPGGSSHNYFGITCYNGQPEKCSRYGTFEEGILGFIKTIKKYDSYLDFTRKYAYLGDYWYNPGSWGDGGCAYASSIYPDGLDSYVLDACSNSRRNLCVAGGTKSGCVATRQEDKDAYITYQSKNMLTTRQNVFGFSTNSCKNDSLNYGNCVLFKQSDGRWGKEALGYGNETLSSAGCAVTSVAIALTCTGEVQNPNFSPKVLNDKLKEMGGFSGGAIEWNNDAIREFVPSFQWIQTYSIPFYESSKDKISKMRVGLEPNHIGIVHLNSTANGHFVVLQSINEQEDTITTLDPAYGDIHTYSITNVDGFKYYTY